MKRTIVLTLIWLSTSICVGQEWPTFRRDNARSGITLTNIDAPRLKLAWTWRAGLPPDPAWDGPARWDAYSSIRDLPAMRQYDACFHPVSDGETVFFGSSSQDTLTAIDLNDGQQRWSFVAGGPIRLAPTLHSTMVLFGCDDGFAYCLDRKTGKLVWRFSPSLDQSAEQRKLLNNDRLISYYPIRTGITVRDGIAYFGASFLPWRESYICAIDVETGKRSESKKTYVKRHEKATLEGSLLVANNRLIVPQGRVAPLLFNRTTGDSLGSLPGGGGVTVVLTEAGEIVRTEGGRASRKGQVSVFKDKERIASFPRGRSIVIAGDRFYVIDGKKLFAAQRNTNELIWSRDLEEPLELVMANETLFVGSRDRVTAVDARTGNITWSSKTEGRVFGLAIAGQRLLAATDTGILYAFAPNAEKALSAPIGSPPSVEFTNRLEDPNEAPPAESFVTWGPITRFLRKGEIEVTYGTKSACPSIVDLISSDQVTRHETDDRTTIHKLLVTGLPHRRELKFQIFDSISDDALASTQFSIDTHFDWTATAKDNVSPEISAIIEKSANPRGMAYVVGEENEALARKLAAQSQFTVVLVASDYAKASELRQNWNAIKSLVYGRELSVVSTPVRELPGASATIVVANRPDEHVRRLVRPEGGILHDGKSVIWTRSPIKGSGVWSHMYGQADNSAFGGEQLSGVSNRKDLVTQWIGRPGPRYQTDRQNRKPSPLAVGGRMFLQGQQRLISLDSYSGTVLWSLETPTIMRWNVPHDCSNWCADKNGVFVAAEDQTWFIDGKTGLVKRRFELPDGVNDLNDKSWGFISRYQNQLIGSVVSTAAIYKKWWGKSQWFDSTGGPDTHVVAADQLFSVDVKSGDPNWSFAGLVLHPTITIMDDKVFFVEDITPTHLESTVRRISIDAGQQFEIVCLDAGTGELQWRHPLPPFAGHVASLYLAGGGEGADRSLILAASDSSQKAFVVQRFDSKTGETLWHRTVAWEANHHGKHISRPAIQGELLYLRPEVLNLVDGTTFHRGFPGGHGCSSYTLSTNGLFSRLGETTWWDVRTQKVNRFERIRTDCWISVVPAQGMLLSAEGGGGCSCGTWLETSLGFLPRVVDEELPEK